MLLFKMNICKILYKLWLDYTWFSMVAMHGENGDKRFRERYGNKY